MIRTARLTAILGFGFYFTLEIFGRYWPVELGTHFYPQFALLSVLLGLYFLRRGTSVSAVGLVVLGFLFIAPFHYLLTDSSTPHPEGRRGLSIAFLNTNNAGPETFSRFSRRQDRDVIFFAGVTPEGRRTIRQTLDSTYPHQEFRVKRDVYGIGVASSVPLRSFRYAHKDLPNAPFGGENPWVKGELKVDSQWIDFWAIHPPRPTRPILFEVRNSVLGFLSDGGNEESFPDFVVGDFNVSPGSPYYQSLRENPYWTSATGGSPFRVTWPASLPPFWIAIDHLFTGPTLRTRRFRVGPSFGSDHYSILGTLVFNEQDERGRTPGQPSD